MTGTNKPQPTYQNKAPSKGAPKAKKTNAARPKQGPKAKPPRARQERDNPYLKTLLDPDATRSIKYPDEFAKASASVFNVINREPYIFKTDTYEPAGTFYGVFSPVAIDPLLELREDLLANTNLLGGVARPDDEVGIYPIDEDVPTAATSSDQMWAGAEQYNLKTQWHWDDQHFCYPGFRGQAAGGVFFGVPINLSIADGTHGVVRVRVTYAGPVPETPSIVSAVCGLGDQTINLTAGPPDSDNSQVWELDAVDLQDAGMGVVHGTTIYVPLPGLGLRYTNTSGGAQLITSYTISMDPAIGSTILPQIRMAGVGLGSESTFCRTVDQYRVVSASLLNTFQGSDLENGGKTAVALYRGGQSPMEVGLYTYDAIGTSPEGMTGKLKDGSYTIWLPNCTEDMEYRVLNSNQRWKLPYIVYTGIVSDPSQPSPMRMRIPINFEVISTDQIFTMTKPVPDPGAILHANTMLREYQTSYPNDLHLEWIRSVLRKAANFGRGAAIAAYNNRDWLVPAASAALALL